MTSFTIPRIKIEPNGLTITDVKLNDRDYNYSRYDPESNLSPKDPEIYSNFSCQSRTRLRRAFNLLIATSTLQAGWNHTAQRSFTFLLNFITLTLSAKQGVYTDYDIKKLLLNDFLTRLRQQKHLDRYIWRSEPQKNGNLHFHISTNQWFDLQYVRDTWNNCQKKLGYIDLFNEKHHHINPNSTDVHSVRNIENSGRYISKYLSKVADDSRLINGKIWDCSQNLKPKARCEIFCQGDDLDYLAKLENCFSDRTYKTDYFKFIPFSSEELYAYLPNRWLNQYNSYLSGVNKNYFSMKNDINPIQL
jgi:hypothetical protein